MSSTLTYTEKQMKKIQITQKCADKVITFDQAMESLSVSERTMYRYLAKLKEEWPPWFIHWLQDRPSNNKWNKSLKSLAAYKPYALKKKYEWFWPTLLAEALEEELWWWKVNVESLRLNMIKWWIWVVKKRKTKVKRKQRERRTNDGMMIQFDWSYHDWLEDWVERCILLAIDDATSNLKKITITKWETLLDMEKYWKEYFETYGKPQSIYLDCHATYKVNHEQDMFDGEMLTRFSRAMQKMKIQIIYSKTPEWKWRVERSFRTLQDRLIKKMRLKWIKTVKEAKKYINEIYIPKHNNKYWKKAGKQDDYHMNFTENDKENYHWYFAKESERSIKRDWTIQYQNTIYQIRKWQSLYKWDKITVKETSLWKIKISSWNANLDYHKVRDL